jgi:hypothetical protein
MYTNGVRRVRWRFRCFPLLQSVLLLVFLVLASSACRKPARSASPTTITLMEWLDKEYQDPRNEEISEFTHGAFCWTRFVGQTELTLWENRKEG